VRPDTLGVIGLGAIGGSVAWQAARAGVRVIGYSANPKEGVQAARAGAVHEVATNPRTVFQASELVVLAAPPLVNLELLAHWGAVMLERGALLTDVTSVKQPFVALAAKRGLGKVFAGSHPLAGTHEQGFAAARPDRFRQAIVYVTGLPDGEDAAREIADFWTTVCESHVVRLDATTHDTRLALTSHLPQAVASALAVTLARQAGAAAVGPGARDTTRLAAGSVEMWRDLLVLNREAVLAAIEHFERDLGDLRRVLQDGDVPALSEWLGVGARWREELD
jgi:prephenate dehydrogenase